MMADVKVVNRTTGQLETLPVEEADRRVAEGSGYDYPDTEELQRLQRKEQFGSAGQQAAAAVESVGRTATFGAWQGFGSATDAAGRRQTLQEQSPGVAFASQAVGATIPGLVTGGAASAAAGALGASTAVAGGAALVAEGAASGIADEVEQAAIDNREVSPGRAMLIGVGGELVGRAIPAAVKAGVQGLRKAPTAAAAVAGETIEDVSEAVGKKAEAKLADEAADMPSGPERDAALAATAPAQRARADAELADSAQKANSLLNTIAEEAPKKLEKEVDGTSPGQIRWASETAATLRELAANAPEAQRAVLEESATALLEAKNGKAIWRAAADARKRISAMQATERSTGRARALMDRMRAREAQTGSVTIGAGAPQELTEQETKALNSGKSSLGFLERPRGPLKEALASAMKKRTVADPGMLWRGMRLTEQQLDGIIRGGYALERYTPTAVERKAAEAFAGGVDSKVPVLMRITEAPEAVMAHGFAGDAFPQERMAILLPGQRYKVARVEDVTFPAEKSWMQPQKGKLLTLRVDEGGAPPAASVGKADISQLPETASLKRANRPEQATLDRIQADGQDKFEFLSPAQQDALNSYTGLLHRDMRATQRGESLKYPDGSPFKPEHAQRIAESTKHLETAMRTLEMRNPTSAGPLYRGVAVDSETLSRLMSHDELVSTAATSTSYNPYTAHVFAASAGNGTGPARHPVVFRINRASEAANLAAFNPGEFEMLLPRGGKFKITGRSRTADGNLLLDVDQVGRATPRDIEELGQLGFISVPEMKRNAKAVPWRDLASSPLGNVLGAGGGAYVGGQLGGNTESAAAGGIAGFGLSLLLGRRGARGVGRALSRAGERGMVRVGEPRLVSFSRKGAWSPEGEVGEAIERAFSEYVDTGVMAELSSPSRLRNYVARVAEQELEQRADVVIDKLGRLPKAVRDRVKQQVRAAVDDIADFRDQFVNAHRYEFGVHPDEGELGAVTIARTPAGARILEHDIAKGAPDFSDWDPADFAKGKGGGRAAGKGAADYSGGETLSTYQRSIVDGLKKNSGFAETGRVTGDAGKLGSEPTFHLQPDGSVKLVHGRLRLTAARELGRDTVYGKVVQGTGKNPATVYEGQIKVGGGPRPGSPAGGVDLAAPPANTNATLADADSLLASGQADVGVWGKAGEGAADLQRAAAPGPGGRSPVDSLEDQLAAAERWKVGSDKSRSELAEQARRMRSADELKADTDRAEVAAGSTGKKSAMRELGEAAAGEAVEYVAERALGAAIPGAGLALKAGKMLWSRLDDQAKAQVGRVARTLLSPLTSNGKWGAARAATVMTALDRFKGDSPDARSAFESRKQMLIDVVASPQIAGQAMASALSGLAKANPSNYVALARRMTECLQYVSSNLPATVGISLAHPTGIPITDSELRDVADLWNTAFDPSTALEAVARRDASPVQMKTLRDLHPDIYRDLQQAIIAQAPSTFAQLDSQTKISIDIMFGSDGTGGLFTSSEAARYVAQANKKASAKPPSAAQLKPGASAATVESSGIRAVRSGVTNKGAA